MIDHNDVKEYQELLDALQRRSELLDRRQEVIDSSIVILKQIIQKLSSMMKQEKGDTSSLARAEAAILLHNLERNCPQDRSSTESIETSQQEKEPALSTDERIRILRRKLEELESR